MCIALLGSRGFIGSEFARQLELGNRQFHRLFSDQINLASPNHLAEKLEELGATALVNCAGYTGKPNVDACEDDKSNCLAGNAVLPGKIAAACEALDIPWGHVSSGCIYTGLRENGEGFTEKDEPNFSFRQNNCSFYSGAKALGEEVLADARRCYIWRLRIPFSNVDSPRNYLTKVMTYDKLLDAENSVSDLTELVSACIDCITKRLPFGTYNLTNPGSITTREVVQMLLDSGLTSKRFEFFESEAEFMKLAAVAPRSNCVLDSSKALAAGLKLTDVRSAMQRAIDTWQPQHIASKMPAE
ncbi:MAG: hypothetical protein Aurels2KO_38130 [Aureliella sp.]